MRAPNWSARQSGTSPISRRASALSISWPRPACESTADSRGRGAKANANSNASAPQTQTQTQTQTRLCLCLSLCVRLRLSLCGGLGEAHRAGDAGAAEPAVTARVLRQVLLMVVLGVVEGRLARDLRRDAPEPRRAERPLVRLARGFGPGA